MPLTRYLHCRHFAQVSSRHCGGQGFVINVQINLPTVRFTLIHTHTHTHTLVADPELRSCQRVNSILTNIHAEGVIKVKQSPLYHKWKRGHEDECVAMGREAEECMLTQQQDQLFLLLCSFSLCCWLCAMTSYKLSKPFYFSSSLLNETP